MSAQIVTVKYNEDNVPYIGLGEHEIRLESEQPKEAVLEKARTELRELPEITGPAINELRELLKGKSTWKFPIDLICITASTKKNYFFVIKNLMGDLPGI